MAQRWMQAKMVTARKNGITISGCNRAMGGVMDDRPLGPTKEAVMFKPIAKRKDAPMVVRLAPCDRPKAWGATKKAKRALSA